MLFLLIFILTLATSYVLPWWAMALIAFAASVFTGTKTSTAFWSGFLAVFLVYTIIALFKSVPNNHVLATRVAGLFHLPHWGFLLFITSLIGGMVGGLAATSGFYIRQLFIIANPDTRKAS